MDAIVGALTKKSRRRAPQGNNAPPGRLDSLRGGGMRMNASLRKRVLLPLMGAIAVMGMLFSASSASANIVRPAGATPIGASTVIAYAPCTAGALQHNPANLPGSACNPPTQYTPRLTAGDPVVNGSAANFRGNIKLVVTTGPTNVQFPSGAPSNNYVNDVRCTPGYASGAGIGVCN